MTPEKRFSWTCRLVDKDAEQIANISLMPDTKVLERGNRLQPSSYSSARERHETQVPLTPTYERRWHELLSTMYIFVTNKTVLTRTERNLQHIKGLPA